MANGGHASGCGTGTGSPNVTSVGLNIKTITNDGHPKGSGRVNASSPNEMRDTITCVGTPEIVKADKAARRCGLGGRTN